MERRVLPVLPISLVVMISLLHMAEHKEIHALKKSKTKFKSATC